LIGLSDSHLYTVVLVSFPGEPDNGWISFAASREEAETNNAENPDHPWGWVESILQP